MHIVTVMAPQEATANLDYSFWWLSTSIQPSAKHHLVVTVDLHSSALELGHQQYWSGTAKHSYIYGQPTSSIYGFNCNFYFCSNLIQGLRKLTA